MPISPSLSKPVPRLIHGPHPAGSTRTPAVTRVSQSPACSTSRYTAELVATMKNSTPGATRHCRKIQVEGKAIPVPCIIYAASAQFNPRNAVTLIEISVKGNDVQSIGALHAIPTIVRACLGCCTLGKPPLIPIGPLHDHSSFRKNRHLSAMENTRSILTS
jgi:hypothetical protein